MEEVISIPIQQKDSELVLGLITTVGTEMDNVIKDIKDQLAFFRYTVEEISVSREIISQFENEKPKFNRAYKVKLEAAYQMNTANKLFLATATTWNVECTKSPFEWLAESIDTFTDVMELGGVAFEKYRTDENRKYIEFTKNLLKQADINISSIEVDAKEVMGGPALPFQIVVQGKIIPPNEGKHYDVEITTGYTVVDENGEKTEFSLTLQEESIGTQLLFFYGPLLKDAFEKGKTIVLDEIDKSMHPSLVKFIMNLFRDPDVNKNGAQLIVTTHETGILSLDMFRRDQIYFTEKDSKSGVTDLYSLDEFSVRKTENIEKGYLMGRYGAIPFLQAGEVL